MESFSALLQPVILISGVGLLILSTTARLGQLEAEVNQTAPKSDGASRNLLRHLLLRARKFRLALMSLYASAAVLAGATLLGGALILFSSLAVLVTQLLTCLAVVGIFVALIALLIESRLAIEALEHSAASAPLVNGDPGTVE